MEENQNNRNNASIGFVRLASTKSFAYFRTLMKRAREPVLISGNEVCVMATAVTETLKGRSNYLRRGLKVKKA